MFPALRSRVRPAKRLVPIITGVTLLALLLTASFEPAFADNLPPDEPWNPDPWIGVTGVGLDSGSRWLYWSAWDPDDGINVTFDLYFGTDPAPPLVKVNGTFAGNEWRYRAASLSFHTTYYWRVVMRDPHGLETSGPTWSFTTKLANEPPIEPHTPTPNQDAVEIPVNPGLSWWGYDIDGDVTNYDVYLGDNPNPPLIAQHVPWTFFQGNPVPYRPAPLNPGTLYYWRIVHRDNGGAETSSPVWTFTTANTANQAPLIPWEHLPLSQVDNATPILSWSATDPDGETLTFDVHLGTWDQYPLPVVGTTTEYQLQVGPLTINKLYYWYVVAKDSYWSIRGPLWTFAYGNVPVLFSRFDARQRGDDVEVRWMLQSDEAMDSYTLFRREGASGSLVAIANEPVQGTEGSYLDTSVMAGRSYQYELVIRTTDGDEFRSQIATVALPALALKLHQNVPNPFNPQTAIRYDLPSSARVRLTIVDVAGRRVRTLVDEQQTAGSREAIWTGRDDMGNPVSSGVYFYVLDVGKQRLTRKLVLLK